MIKEKRRRIRRLKKTVKIMSLVAFLIVVLFLLIWNVFRVEKVDVEGNELYSSEQIQKVVLNDEYSWNSLYVYFKYRLFPLEKVPFVDTVEVSLENPTTVHIKVYEKGMMGYIYIPSIEQNAYFDKDGFVVETSSEIIPDVPMISGLECDQVVLCEKLPLEDKTLRGILSLTQALKKYDLVPDALVYGIDHEPGIVYGSVTVLMGDLTSQTQKVERLAQILPSLTDSAGTLHMENWSEENTDIVFDRAM